MIVKQTRNDLQFRRALTYSETNLQNWRSYIPSSVQQISRRDSKICLRYVDSTGVHFERKWMKNNGTGSSNKTPLLLLQQRGQWKICRKGLDSELLSVACWQHAPMILASCHFRLWETKKLKVHRSDSHTTEELEKNIRRLVHCFPRRTIARQNKTF
jgi:hypothetical protein